MRTYLASGEMDNALAKASTVLATTLPDSEYENWAAWRVYLPHATVLLENLVEDSEASAHLCMKAGWHLTEFGRYSEALILYERARKLYLVMFGEENTKTLKAMYRIGCSLKCVGRLKEAQGIQEKVLEVRRRTLGDEHTDTLKSMQNLAITYKDMGGRLKELQELEEKVLEVSRRTLGEGHKGTVDAMHNLALTLYDMDRMEEAISLMEEVACSYARIYGSDHSETKDAEQSVNDWKDEIEDDDGEYSIYGGAEDSDESE